MTRSTMRRAALCADLAEVVLGPWMPRGPQGGIHDGTMTVTVLVDTCGRGSEMPPLDSVVAPLEGDPRGQAPPPRPASVGLPDE
ncbi:hypothetical protein [Nocardia abscessus]|uniref:hypothetical protein n=1 Tax=Nocardia abscessus TaxID=120957 RepID=UPI0024557435|nr:hypothetical protein [Nocardia abscessus]